MENQQDEFIEIRARFRPTTEVLTKFIEAFAPAASAAPVSTSRPVAPAAVSTLDEREAMKKLFGRLSPGAKEFCLMLAAKKGEVSSAEAAKHLKLVAMSGLTSRLSYAAKKFGLTFDQLIERRWDDQWVLHYSIKPAFASVVEETAKSK